MGRHVWSDEVKEQALLLLADPELSYYDVHKRTGVPASTLCHWASVAGLTGHSNRLAETEKARAFRSERIALKRGVMAEKFLDYAETMADQAAELAEGLIEVKEGVFISGGRDALALMQASQLAMNSHRLEMGEATGRVEIDQRPSKAVEEKLDELAERREAKA